VTANAQSKVYDGTATFASPTHSVSGLINAATYGNVFTQDGLTGSLAVTAPGRNVGSYAIGLGTLVTPGGYNLTYAPANASVTAAPLTIQAGVTAAPLMGVPRQRACLPTTRWAAATPSPG
jgi:hypothetical protein